MNESQTETKAYTVEAIDMFGNRKIYKAVVEFISMGEERRITLFTQATGFEMARHIIGNTTYVKEKNGHIVSLAEVNGVFVE